MKNETSKEFLSMCGYGSGTNFTPEIVADLMESYATHKVEKAQKVFDEQLSEHGTNRYFEGIKFAREEKTQYEKDFTKGYACAVANLVSMYGDSTEAWEVLRCNFISIEHLIECGVEQSDINTLMPVILEIKRKRELENL